VGAAERTQPTDDTTSSHYRQFTGEGALKPGGF
jgi:hypothetical protein